MGGPKAFEFLFTIYMIVSISFYDGVLQVLGMVITERPLMFHYHILENALPLMPLRVTNLIMVWNPSSKTMICTVEKLNCSKRIEVGI